MVTLQDESSVHDTFKRRRFLLAAICTLAVGVAAGAGAKLLAGGSAGPFKADAINAGDTAWVLAASALVMIMTPAVGFFYGGMVRSKNVVSVIKQSMVILALVSIQWVLFGYSLAFGKDIGGGLLGGLGFFGLNGVGYAPNPDYAPTIPHLAFMIFQAMFAIITPALIIGAFVERIRFRTMVVFVLLWATLVYDPIAHWVWNPDGWLHKLGALDFAGGTVVHASSGFAALAAAIIVGKRIGFKRGEATEANALTWMALSWIQNGRPSALATVTGAVCGLVAITPASGFVGPLSSIAIGVLGGLVTYLMLLFRSKRTQIDDTLDVWAAHGMGGVTGAILTGVFAEKVINGAGANGLLFGNPGQLLTQILAVLVTAGYSFVVTFLLLKLLSFMGLRVTDREEALGLDIAAHGEEGYRIVPREEMPEPDVPLQEPAPVVYSNPRKE